MLAKMTFLTLVVVCSSSLTQAGVEAYGDKSAKERVDSYLALRRACSITRGEQRQECFKMLNEATKGYKSAKKELAMQKAMMSDQPPLLSQAR